MNSLRLKDYLFVGIQLVFIILYFWLPADLSGRITWLRKGTGILLLSAGTLIGGIAVLQLNIRLSVFPSPVRNARLITSGVFHYVRHPIYTGIFLAGMGYGLYTWSFTKLLIATMLLVFFSLKSDYEEHRLEQKFPEYTAYKNTTGKFFPLWKKKKKA